MVNHGEFLFIYAGCEADCLESLKSVDALKVPSGYSLSKLVLPGGYHICDGYNFALRNSSAKYKVYLHPKIIILHQNFMSDVAALFTRYPRLGMLGVMGALKLPANGNWWEAPGRCGKFRINGQLLEYPVEISSDYQPVQGIDGKIIITQYDIPWRSDLFTKPFFHDTAQCLEFIKAGYQVGVPCQNEPWCAYENPHDAIFLYEQAREVFVHEYREYVKEENQV
jgi:hypothetical protein